MNYVIGINEDKLIKIKENLHKYTIIKKYLSFIVIIFFSLDHFQFIYNTSLIHITKNNLLFTYNTNFNDE